MVATTGRCWPERIGGGPVAMLEACELLQVYLYGDAVADLDALMDVVADEEARGAELIEITRTFLPTGGSPEPGSSSSEEVAVLTFRCPATHEREALDCPRVSRAMAQATSIAGLAGSCSP